MKKIVSIILTLCLLCGTVAFADTAITDSSKTKTATTTVSYTVEEKYEYTVTIPSAIDLTSGSQNMEIAIEAPDATTAKKKIVVKMTANSYENSYYTMTNGDSKIRYQIVSGNDKAVSPETWSLAWKANQAYTGTGVRTELTAKVVEADLTNAAVGTYTDTLTFTVSLEDVH